MSELNRATYNLIARHYEEDHGDSSFWHGELKKFVTGHIDNAEIVDLGSGPGKETAWLARTMPQSNVTGIDFSDAMITLAQQQSTSNTHFVLADITSYVHPTPVDGIWARASLHHLNDNELSDTFLNISSYLKPGGLLVCINKSGTGDAIKHTNQYGHDIQRYFNFFTSEKVESLAERFNFTILQQRTIKEEDTSWLISSFRKN